jgi:hypothetical protein
MIDVDSFPVSFSKKEMYTISSDFHVATSRENRSKYLSHFSCLLLKVSVVLFSIEMGFKNILSCEKLNMQKEVQQGAEENMHIPKFKNFFKKVHTCTFLNDIS